MIERVLEWSLKNRVMVIIASVVLVVGGLLGVFVVFMVTFTFSSKADAIRSRINGKVRQSCSALVDRLLVDNPTEIELQPMTKFPVVRDLVVDRDLLGA